MQRDSSTTLMMFASMLHHLGGTKSDQMTAAMMVEKEEDRFRLTKWMVETMPSIDEALTECMKIHYDNSKKKEMKNAQFIPPREKGCILHLSRAKKEES